jgi:hypothetical protein
MVGSDNGDIYDDAQSNNPAPRTGRLFYSATVGNQFMDELKAVLQEQRQQDQDGIMALTAAINALVETTRRSTPTDTRSETPPPGSPPTNLPPTNSPPANPPGDSPPSPIPIYPYRSRSDPPRPINTNLPPPPHRLFPFSSTPANTVPYEASDTDDEPSNTNGQGPRLPKLPFTQEKMERILSCGCTNWK